MNPLLCVIDSFFHDIEAVRAAVLAEPFADVTNPADGVVYPGISQPPQVVVDELVRGVGVLVGRTIEVSTVFCRATYANMVASNKIHSDLVMGDFAAHVYLSPEWPAGAGTSFFTNKKLGMRHRPGTPPEVVRTNEPEDWDRYCSVQARQNRLLVHRGDAWHLAEPVGGWGTSPADGRLVITLFFT